MRLKSYLLWWVDRLSVILCVRSHLEGRDMFGHLSNSTFTSIGSLGISRLRRTNSRQPTLGGFSPRRPLTSEDPHDQLSETRSEDTYMGYKRAWCGKSTTKGCLSARKSWKKYKGKPLNDWRQRYHRDQPRWSSMAKYAFRLDGWWWWRLAKETLWWTDSVVGVLEAVLGQNLISSRHNTLNWRPQSSKRQLLWSWLVWVSVGNWERWLKRMGWDHGWCENMWKIVSHHLSRHASSCWIPCLVYSSSLWHCCGVGNCLGRHLDHRRLDNDNVEGVIWEIQETTYVWFLISNMSTFLHLACFSPVLLCTTGESTGESHICFSHHLVVRRAMDHQTL